MTPSSIPGLIGLVLLLLAVARVDAKIHPRWKARMIAVLSLATFAAVGAFVFLTLATFYAGLLPTDLRPAGTVLADVATHGIAVPPVVGGLLTLAFAWSLWRVVRAWRGSRRETRALGDAGVVESPRAFAVAVPGGGGRIVVSSALLSLLSPDEVRAVYLHEHAHLRRGHHRYMVLTSLLVAALPPLASVHSAMRLSVERWADEEAADAVGDRALVAKSLAKVALANAAPGPALGFADFHTTRRVERLLGPGDGPRSAEGGALFGLTGGLAGVISGGPLQVQHLLPLLAL